MANDPFDELAQRLRQSVGGEFREEAAEDESLSELQRRRRRGLAETVRSAMHRGDRINASVAGLSLAYPVVGVGADYLIMDAGEQLIDVRLDASTFSLLPQQEGGAKGTPAATTFAARLAEHEQSHSAIEVVMVDGTRTAGTIRVAAADHVALESPAGETIIPHVRVAAVFSPR